MCKSMGIDFRVAVVLSWKLVFPWPLHCRACAVLYVSVLMCVFTSQLMMVRNLS